MSIIDSFLQNIFFKRVRGAPNKRWVSRASSQGEFSKFTVERNKKKISCCSIVPKRNQPEDCTDPIVVLSHPISRKAKYFFSETERSSVYLSKGLRVFAFDYNGFGESDSIDLYYWQDVVTVLNAIKIRFPGRRIILHGASFGAFHIIRALDYLPANSTVILENVNKSLLSYWRRWPLTAFLVRLLMLMRFRPIMEMDVRSVAQNFDRPDLHIRFIACEKDDFTTLEEMRELYCALATVNKSFTVFDGAAHLAAPSKDPLLYQSALFVQSAIFLEDHDCAQ